MELTLPPATTARPGDFVASALSVKRNGKDGAIWWHVSGFDAGGQLKVRNGHHGWRRVDAEKWVVVYRPPWEVSK